VFADAEFQIFAELLLTIMLAEYAGLPESIESARKALHNSGNFFTAAAHT